MTFGFATAADIRFGRGTSSGAAAAAARVSNRALLIHGKSAARAHWLVNDLLHCGVRVETIACSGEPDIAMVDAALTVTRQMRPGVVIALGGGAAIDLGKAVAALASARGSASAYLEIVGEARPLDATPLPFIAIPTTAGTGAEVTKNAVIGVPDAQKKVSLRDARMIPDIAIIDPALTDTAPAHVTFSSGFDAITQVIEPFLSIKASPLTDALCRDAIPRGLSAILRLAEGEDPVARDDMALTSLFGGIALANAGLGALHGLAGIIGGRIAAPHGELCATLLPHVLQFNAGSIPEGGVAAGKMAEVLQWVGDALGVPSQEAPVALDQRLAALGIRSLGELGFRKIDIEAVAPAARVASSSKTNPVAPADTDFQGIMRNAYTC